jgi:hypothetical protein
VLLKFTKEKMKNMNLVSLRVITADIKRLVQFFEGATGITARWFTEDFAELATSSGTLAIGSTRTLAVFGGDCPASRQQKRYYRIYRGKCGR